MSRPTILDLVVFSCLVLTDRLSESVPVSLQILTWFQWGYDHPAVMANTSIRRDSFKLKLKKYIFGCKSCVCSNCKLWVSSFDLLFQDFCLFSLVKVW